MARSCYECRNRKWDNFGSAEYCMEYEMFPDPAPSCKRFVMQEEEESCAPPSTAGDYSPSNPWDAPGMSIRDFI